MSEGDYIVHPVYANIKIPVEETWKAIPGYEESYEASTRGRVKSLGRWRYFPNRQYNRRVWYNGKILKSYRTPFGYIGVGLHKDGQQKTYSVHGLVLLTFVGRCPEGMEARHFPDGSPQNNNLENLSWGTHTQNIRDRFEHGTDMAGEKNGSSVLTNDDAIYVLQLFKEDERKYKNYRGKRTKGRAYPYGRRQRIAKLLEKNRGVRITPEMIGLIITNKNWKCLR